MTTFRYTPLKPNEVRLLKPTSDGGLNFELVHKVIDTRPRYSALSYTWGEPEPCEAIVLDGQHFTVRQNLHDALQRLTSRARGRSRLIAKGSLFWVDALCIDQSNLTERSQEVRMMRQIYEQAQRVFVWLGEPENTRHSDLAERKLKEFAKLQRNAQLENHGYHPWWLPKKAPRWQEEVYQAEISVLGYRSSPAFRIFWDGEGSKTQQAWLGIIDMWRKRWWGRTWIFQEATISQKMSTFYISLPWGSSWMNPIQSKVLFLCGWAQVQWTEMFSALTVAQQLRSAPDLDTRILEDTCEKPRKLAILSVQRLQGQNTSFLEFLQTFRVSESQDPRDKVFAPLGLAPGEVTHDIKVDYERPVSDVYMDVVRALIHLPNVALNFLAYAVPQFGHNPHSLPSWVPDWDYPVTVLPLPKCLHFTLEESGRAIVPYDQRNNLTDFIKGSIQHSVYNTSRGTQVKSFIDGSLLGLFGVCCDTITDVFTLSPLPSPKKVHRWASRYLDSRYGPTNESFDQAYRRTLTADVQYDLLGRACARDFAIDPNFLRKPVPTHTMDIHNHETQDAMTTSLKTATFMRSICFTERGFIGLVPENAAVGDKVYLFLGGQVLYTLRPVKSDSLADGRCATFRFVGETYLHGLMDGEAMTWVERGQASVEEVLLV